MKLAPIAMFVYKRPQHASRTLEALKLNDLAAESDLVIYSDGPKSDKDVSQVEAVRKLCSTIVGFKSVRVVEQERNLGLARSIISGVSDIVNTHGRSIVLEDDMVTSPHFLRYMNEALDLYENDEEVISIHGYVYPVKDTLPETFFLRGADCWGWATWKRGWVLFEPDGSKLLAKLETRQLERDFDFNASYAFTSMLRCQIAGSNDSWAVRWYASAFLLNKLTLYPGTSLVHNIGLDSSGTHSGTTTDLDVKLASEPINLLRIKISEDNHARDMFSSYFRSLRSPKSKVWAYIKDFVKRR